MFPERALVVPVTLLIVFLLLCLNFGKLTGTFIVMLSLPFSLVGGLWFMWWKGFNLSADDAVSVNALGGVAAREIAACTGQSTGIRLRRGTLSIWNSTARRRSLAATCG